MPIIIRLNLYSRKIDKENVFEIVRFVNNGFAMEIKSTKHSLLTSSGLLIEETKSYLKGSPRTHTSPLPDRNLLELTRVHP